MSKPIYLTVTLRIKRPSIGTVRLPSKGTWRDGSGLVLPLPPPAASTPLKLLWSFTPAESPSLSVPVAEQPWMLGRL